MSSASARAVPGSPSVPAQLRAAEDRLEALHARHAELKSLARLPAVDRAWIERRLEDLAGLLRADPIRARAEIAKHLAGPLVVTPRPSPAGIHQVEVNGNVAADSLFGELRALPLVIASGDPQSPKWTRLRFEADLI